MAESSLRHGAGAVAALLVPLLLIQGAVVAVLAGPGSPWTTCTSVRAPSPSAPASSASFTLTPEQAANAASIIDVAQRLRLPARAAVIAVATALQESGLRDLDHGDRDSLGLFQQRPSQGWGHTPTGPTDHRTPTQRLLDPAYAATAFYTQLLTIPDWANLPLTQAADAVQRSARPDAYATWEPLATQIVGSTARPGDPPPAALDTACAPGDGDSQTLPAGFTLPPGTPTTTATAITWALQQLGTPYHYGGDCTAPHSGIPAHQCDCSSLVQMAFKTAGITLPRTTTEQAATGRPVNDINHLQPGDLIFIPGSDGTPTNPQHVGIYLGQGLIIHAPHTNQNVKISTLNTWTSMIVAIRSIS